MSDEAWAAMIATVYDLEAIQAYHSELADQELDFEVYWQKVQAGTAYVHPRYRTDIDHERTASKRAEAEDAWKASIWKQAVMHAELKARLGHEAHWLLFHLTGMNHSHLRGHTYTGYVQCITYCECCFGLLGTVIIEDPKNWPEKAVCEKCQIAGHEASGDMYSRWHELIGLWWVEILRDTGPDYYPRADCVWFENNGDGEDGALAVAQKQLQRVGLLDAINIYRPDGTQIQFHTPEK